MNTIEFNTNLNTISDGLNGFAYKLTKNKEAAKDLYQETALRAIKNSHKFRVGTNYKAWVMTIMKNIFINNYRKRSKMRMISDSNEDLYFMNSGIETISNQAESNMVIKELEMLIMRLPSSLRKPLEMHVEGYKYTEIATQLFLPLGTVKSRIFIARRDLKEQIQRGEHWRVSA